MSKENETRTEEAYGEGTLTEEELLMLDSLLYYGQFSDYNYESKHVADFVEDCKNGNFSTVTDRILSDDKSGFSQIVEYISQNDKLMDLEIVYSSSQIELSGSNAVCLRDSKNNLYVLYGGNYADGDYDGDGNNNTSESTWQDNLMGAIMVSTREQEEAVCFFDKVIDEYGENANHIIVSGHSKGGNLAQIVTIMCGENVTACLSIDGQGVSYDFLKENSDKIDIYGNKITSIMPSKSYIGSLMYQIENANYIYIDSKMISNRDILQKILPNGDGVIVLMDMLLSHFPKSLLDDDWKLREEKEQSLISKCIHQMSIELTDYASEDRYFSEEDKKVISNAMDNLGIVILELTNSKTNWDRVKTALLDEDTVTYFFRSALGIFPQELEETLTGIYYEMIDVMEGYIDNIVTGWKIIGDWFGDNWARLFGIAVNVRIPADPLILDLQGDGFNIELKKYGVNFDLNCDGFAEKINWTNRDAILAVDLNGNGKIDNGREVFGDYHLLADGTRAVNGFEALAQYDTNGDGIIDENDEIFTKLCLWIDSNSDGISDTGELKSLNELGIKAINLNCENTNRSTGTEALIGNVAKFIYMDDTEGDIGEMWVASDLFDTVETFITNISEAIDGLPDVRSYGKVNSLHQAMAMDESGNIQQLVEKFVNETDNERRIEIVKMLLDLICDTVSIEEGSRGEFFSARKLAVIEKFMGENFMGVNGTNPNFVAAPILENVYKQIVEMYCFAMVGSKLTKHLDKLIMIKNEDGTASFNTDFFNVYLYCLMESGKMSMQEFADICSYLGYFGTNVQENYEIFYKVREFYEAVKPEYLPLIDESVFGAIRGNDDNNHLNGTTVSDLIYGNGGNDTISGSNGNDLLIGGSGNDTITGGSSNDILYGDGGNDILDGEAGDDILKDSEGDDTFVFTKGYGHDTIQDEGGHNTIRFSGLNPNDILVNGTGEYDVTIRIKGTDDTLVIKNFKKDEKYADYDLEFNDVKMHVTDENSPFKHIYGSDDDDILKAVVDDSIMHAFGGDDTVIGSKGDDVIYGNAGNDAIHAGCGNDTIYGGDDNDEIYGGVGHDVLYGENGDDVLDGGVGNDLLFGGAGNDTYLFGVGYGTDILTDSEGTSTIQLAGGLTLSDICVTMLGAEVIIHINGTDDRLIINGYQNNVGNYIIQAGEESIFIKEYLESNADETGSYVADSDENTVAYTSGTANSDAIFAEDNNNFIGAGNGYDYIIGGSENDYIFGDGESDRILAGDEDDTVYGGVGNDQLFGENGNDILSGGDGDDYINGGDGNDLIFGGTGNDYMDGGVGDDIYHFNVGDGQDAIADSKGLNTIIFGAGITAEGIKAYRSNWNDLLITFEGSDDTLIIKNYCADETARNFKLIFADGTVTEAMGDSSPLKTIYGTQNSDYEPTIYETGTAIRGQDGDDQLVGSDKADLLYGEGGNDRILGNGGNDILYGGTGNDYLAGGAGDDTYVYRKGDGVDTISDNVGTNTINIEGYVRQDIRAYRTNWNELTIEFGNSDGSDKLVIEGFFNAEANRNFYLTFNGGSRVHAIAGNSPLRTIYGTDGDDYMVAMDDGGVTLIGENGNDMVNGGNGSDNLYGGAGDDRILGNGGNDTLYGGTGNDYLSGGAGNDTYIFNKGDGTDTISDGEGVNTIYFGSGFDVDALTAYRTNWNDLTITFAGNEDKLIIQGYFNTDVNRRFNVRLADGTYYSYDDADNPINHVHVTEQDDWMRAWSDDGIILYGDGGNDTLYGGVGNDVLVGGVGNDTLNGGLGDDSYIFGIGDGNDIINDTEGINTISFRDITSDKACFFTESIGDRTKLTISVTGSGESITINDYQQENYIFEFSDEVKGMVDVDGIFTETVTETEDELASTIANTLINLYEEDTVAGTETVIPGVYIADTLNAVYEPVSVVETVDSITEEENISIMTDLQVMKLTEEMSGFGGEGSVTDGMVPTMTDGVEIGTDLLIVAVEIQ